VVDDVGQVKDDLVYRRQELTDCLMEFGLVWIDPLDFCEQFGCGLVHGILLL